MCLAYKHWNIFLPKQAHHHIKWHLGPFLKTRQYVHYHRCFASYPWWQSIFHWGLLYHLFDLHWFDLGLICFGSIYVRTGDMWHWHLLMWPTIALTTSRAGLGIILLSVERRIHGFMTDVWPDGKRPGLIINSSENTKCPGLCETSLVMLLIAVELNTDVSGVWCTFTFASIVAGG